MFIYVLLLKLTYLYLDVIQASDTPRVKMKKQDVVSGTYPLPGHNDRIELLEGPLNNTIYVGCSKLVFVNFRNRSQSKVDDLGFSITVLHTGSDGKSLFVCGTADKKCCNVSSEALGNCVKTHSSNGIAPFSVTERAPSIFIGEELYSTANTVIMGDGIGTHRHFGPNAKIWSERNKTEQRYVGLMLSGPRADKIHDKVYTFLVERSLDQHPEADNWVSKVTQVCKVDQGGPKGNLQWMWTSLLSAQLSCGIPENKLYFHRLLDVALLHADDWSNSRVYALFTNGWNMSAVCVYTMGDIDHIFTNSNFRGYTESIPHPRPGTCSTDSRKTPPNVLNLIKENLEMADLVRPVHDGRPLIVSRQCYKHIRVDKVEANHAEYTVLFLSLENGRIHQVLEQESQTFTIAELDPFSQQTSIQNMLLQRITKKLYVSSSSEVMEVDLLSCQTYGESCQECVLARNPYCGWHPQHQQCTAASSHTIQDVRLENPRVCTDEERAGNLARYTAPLKIPSMASYFLKCPMRSRHASYSWFHNGKSQDCLFTDSDCLLLMDMFGPEQEGHYYCEAQEGGYTRKLVEHSLQMESRARGLVSSSLVPACLLLFIMLLF